jgi:ferredoxin
MAKKGGRLPAHVKLLSRGFSLRHRLARLTRLPLIGAAMDRALFAGDEMYLLPREPSVPMDRDLGSFSSVVLPSQLVAHFIDRAEHLFIMDFCICRMSAGCTDYPRDLGCLFLGEAAAHISPSLGRAATREEAHEHVRRCREAGLVHLVGRNRLDAVWLGTGQPDRLMTVCSCCPCCCLWMMLPSLAPAIGDRITGVPGVRVFVTDSCTGCGVCMAGACFVGALSMKGGVAAISDACRACGRCVEACPEGAIRITVAPGAFDSAIASIERTVAL